MSHQTGIQLSESLKEEFVKSNAPGARRRLICVLIQEEQLCMDKTAEKKGDVKEDFELVGPLLSPSNPCYILYRQDTPTTPPFKWILLAWVPDTSKVRDKMVYAATRSTLLKGLGEAHFTETIHGTEADEFTPEGYARHLKHLALDAPLTEREEELERVRRVEQITTTGSSNRRTHVAGIALPMSSEVTEGLKDLSDQGNTYILLSIKEGKGEEVQVDKKGILDKDTGLESIFPTDAPRFCILRPSDLPTPSVLFFYCCPSGSPIRHRMLYSSFRNAIIHDAENSGLTIRKKVESDDPTDWDAKGLAELIRELSSSTSSDPKSSQAPNIVRPAGPAGRRPATRPPRRTPVSSTIARD